MRTLIKKEQVLDQSHCSNFIQPYLNDPELVIESKDIQEKLEKFILDQNHPCLMAQSVFKSGRYLYGIYKEIGTRESAAQIHNCLHKFLAHNDSSAPQKFSSFIAVFMSDNELDEEEFESKMWKQLQFLHEVDAPKYTWDSKVSSDPNDPQFSFSLLERAFYLIGLHPNSSRLARKFDYQAIVFNLHEQFEMLRDMNSYDKVTENIRTRDKELQGSINPMLAKFGEVSETRQYSGRMVDDGWKCPFHNVNK